MPWFRVDDDFAFHPKAIAAGNAALGLWVRAGAYAAQYLTEGFVPSAMLPALGGRQRDAEALVTARLWVSVEGGYRFHEWDDRQPSRQQVQADRAAAAERQRRARARAREARPPSRGDATPDVTRDSRSPRPGPARPTNPLLTMAGRLSGADASDDGRLPAVVISSWQEFAGPGVDLEAEARAYLARHVDHPARDERGAWLGWLDRARNRQAARPAAADPEPPSGPSWTPCQDHPDQPAGRCPHCEAAAVPPPTLIRARRTTTTRETA